jgi:hypothetical protein
VQPPQHTGTRGVPQSTQSGAGRPGAFILPADAPGAIAGREKLVCIGRKHPRYQRIVTWESAERACHAAVAAGRARIRLSEI